jgi:hypothetical protein
VTIGDSYVSGEGARFAGNTSGDRVDVDALGEDAYLDRGQTESQPGCHRASLWPGLVDTPRVGSVNLACSGATTRSFAAGRLYKPGLDFATDRRGHGQLRDLRRFALSHPVTDIVVSIGGNDAGFGRIVGSCLVGYLDPNGRARPCSETGDILGLMRPDALDAVARSVGDGLRRVARAMGQAGYGPGDYAITLLTYPSPIPPADQLRYPEERRAPGEGGCPMLDVDADWAAQVVVPRINAAVTRGMDASELPNVGILDLARVLVGHRLCEEGAARFDELSAADWRAPGLVNALEWVNEVSFDFSRTQGSLHPNYWGVQVIRDCVREAVTGDDARSARCIVARDGGSSQTAPAIRLVG